MTDTTGALRSREVTQLLARIEDGDREAADSLLPLVYAELRVLARSSMGREPAGHTLQPTALVHEAYLRLVGRQDPGWSNRGHFFGAAARAMRRLLVERARRVRRLRHGGGLQRTDVDAELLIQPGGSIAVDHRAVELLDLDAALRRLADLDEGMARTVELRFFGGLEVAEVAELLGVSRRTVERRWTGARAWLRRELAAARRTRPGEET
ncbi:MAG: RNA polymerase subunit sigma [Acidobacteria bacterium]|nr:MAG: RNA polymerase subunit sigma [Acidobacteriota bacterium]REK03261.1 MAG: RNA polymerase subunit sigma [Acidobacteriota bacterium]